MDYPVYHSVPHTNFHCGNVPVHPGMYANVESGCQVLILIAFLIVLLCFGLIVCTFKMFRLTIFAMMDAKEIKVLRFCARMVHFSISTFSHAIGGIMWIVPKLLLSTGEDY